MLARFIQQNGDAFKLEDTMGVYFIGRKPAA
jgi:hypothetical protein